MGNTLDAVLQLKAQKQASELANAKLIGDTLSAINQARENAANNAALLKQNSTENNLKTLLTAAQINKLNREDKALDPESSIQKISDINNRLKTILPDYRASQTSSGQFTIEPKPITGSEFSMGMKEDQFKQKRLQTMGDDLDPSKNVRNAYGVAQLNLSRAERLQGLVSQYPDMNLDRRETEELAIGLNSLLQGSNVSARSQVESLIPQSVRGNVQKLAEWLGNEPQGLQQQEFVKRMFKDAMREKDVAQGQVYKFARAKVSKYSDIINKYPEEATGIMRSFGIDPEQYNEWKKAGFKDEAPLDVADRNNKSRGNDIKPIDNKATGAKTKKGVSFSYTKKGS